MIAILVLLFCFGLVLEKKNKPYKEKEKELITISKIYTESQVWLPKNNETVRITIDELIENGLIKPIKVKDDKCNGYILVKKKQVLEYKTFLKCTKYKTIGYE